MRPRFAKSSFFVILACLVGGLFGAAGADWFSPDKPKYKATEFLGHAPGNSLVALAWTLQGQVDFEGLTDEVDKLLDSLPEDERKNFQEFKEEFGVPLAEWVRYFTGNGYLAASDISEEAPRFTLALELAKPEPFSRWLLKVMEDDYSTSSHRGLQVYRTDDEDPLLCVGRGWFFLVNDEAELDSNLDALEGRRRLSENSRYQTAVSALGMAQSGLCLYVDGPASRQDVYREAGVTADMPGVQDLEFWDYGILSVDFQARETQGLLAYNDLDNNFTRALRIPGRVDAKLFDLLPANMSTMAALDLGWGKGVIDGFADVSPDVGMFINMAMMQLKTYGDPFKAFTGEVVVGTDLMDKLGPMLAYGPSRYDQSAAGCEMNLYDIQGKLELAGGKWDEVKGDLPDCPAAGYPTYQFRKLQSGGYQIYCAGHNHPKLKEDQPALSDGYELTMEYIQEPEEPKIPAVFAVARLGDPAEADKLITALTYEPPASELDECVSNLKNLGTAMEMYSTDYAGKYPTSTALLTPNYLRTLPACPAAGTDTYSATMRTGPDAPGNEESHYQDYYYLECHGNHHPETLANYPRYNGIIGLDRGPIQDVPVAFEDSTPAPVGNDVKTYEIGGPALKLDPNRKLLIFAGGDGADGLVGATRTEALPRLLADALEWGDGKAVYLIYNDLDGLYKFGLDYARRGEMGGQERLMGDMLVLLKRMVGDLQDAQCIKVTDRGLRYRGQGYNSSPALGGAGLVGAAVMVPNFARARSQGQLTACKSNLKNIGTALEMYSTDWSGNYPESLGKLTPNYLKTIPNCPVSETDTYTDSYTHDNSKKDDNGWGTFEIFCQGHNHESLDIPEDYPRYSSVEGLIER